MKYGILFGIALHLVLLGYLVMNTRLFGGTPANGLAIFAICVCGIITELSITNKLKIPVLDTISMVALAFVLPIYLGINGLIPPVLGSASSGAIIWGGPGALVGAIVGAIRRGKIPKAPDAKPESALLWIGSSACVTIAIWLAFRALLLSYSSSLISYLH